MCSRSNLTSYRNNRVQDVVFVLPYSGLFSKKISKNLILYTHVPLSSNTALVVTCIHVESDICKDRAWVSVVVELSCRERTYSYQVDRSIFAVAVTKDCTIVGHMPSQFVHCSCSSLEASVAT